MDCLKIRSEYPNPTIINVHQIFFTLVGTRESLHIASAWIDVDKPCDYRLVYIILNISV